MKRILSAVCVLAATGAAPAQDIATAQAALALLGYDPGPVDGAWGGKTRSALEALLAKRNKSFDGRLDGDDFALLRRELQNLTYLDIDFDAVPQLDFEARFEPGVAITVPAEYAFTEGESQPRLAAHDYTVPFPFVGDVDGDSCDDVIMQFGDSLAHPRIVHGRPDLGADGEALHPEPATAFPKSRTIRNIARRDMDGDGKPDLVAFTSSHRLDGIGFAPADEPDIVVTAGTARATGYPTFAHDGLVGDVDGDGIADVFPIVERGGSGRYALLGGGFEQRFRVRALDDETIFGAASADLNGDGIDDFIMLTARDYTRDKWIDPQKAGQGGTFAVALGAPGKSINDLTFIRYGTHWMDTASWTLFRLQPLSDAGYDTGDDWYYSAPSNIDLLDFDDDGDLDLLVGYFVSSRSSWVTSGFQLYRNDDGAFADVTAELAPLQPENRTVVKPTEAMMGAQLLDLDGDGHRDLLLSLQTDDVSSYTGVRGAIYLNRDGRFVPVRAEMDMLATHRYLQAGDFNCDGQPDLVGVGHKSATEQHLRLMFGKPGPEQVATTR